MNKLNKLVLYVSGVFFWVSASIWGYGQTTENENFLYQIQDKVYDAFLYSFQDNSLNRLKDIEDKLKQTVNQNQMVDYWLAYTKYYESLYYLKSQNREEAQKTLSSAISLLEETESKNTETFALLAYLQSFSLQFPTEISAATISSKVKENVEAALKADSTNLRAWYVLASTDYYTPVAFGGGKNCEQYLLNAISLKDQTTNAPYMPSWGKSEAYALLIEFYVGKENYSKAKEYLNEALTLYPDDYMINQYVEKLRDK